MIRIRRDAALNERKTPDVDGSCRLQPLSITVMDGLLLDALWF